MIEFADPQSLHEHLLALNYEQGVPPEVSGYDSVDRPAMAWLIESGGDDTWPLAAYVGGSDAAVPDLIECGIEALSYPVRITPHPAANQQVPDQVAADQQVPGGAP